MKKIALLSVLLWVAQMGFVNAQLPLQIPVALKADSVHTMGFIAHWDHSSADTAFFLDVATDFEFTNIVLPYSKFSVINASSANVTVPYDGTTYYYRVRAYCVYGETGFSNTTEAKTIAKIHSNPAIYYSNNIKAELYSQIMLSVNDAEAVSFQWFRNNVALDNSSEIEGAQSDTLKLNQALYSDQGSYFCVRTYNTKDAPDTTENVNLEIENPLPIELLNFSSANIPNGIELLWATATETNNGFFTVERSTDAINYNALATLQGANFSSTTSRYRFIDENATHATTYYYRLRQTDNDGASKIVAVLSHTYTSQALAITDEVFYSHLNNAITLNVLSEEDNLITCRVFNLSGALIKDMSFDVAKGLNTCLINTSDFTAGILIVEIMNNNQRVVKKVKIS